MILFSDRQSEMFFFSDRRTDMNPKQSEIWRGDMKFFAPIWNHSETDLKLIWKKRTNMKYFQIDNLK